MSGTENVQQLFEAEKKALAIVAEAKKERLQKLKNARDEAQKELSTFQHTLDERFNEFKNKKLDGADTASTQIQEKKNHSVEAIKDSVTLNKNAIIDLIVKKVTDVHIE